MADIEIVYREYSCDYNPGEFCTQCLTCCAGDMGCRYFYEGDHKANEIPFGNCEHYDTKYKYKGWSGKRYEIEECNDPYNPHLDGMLVTLGNHEYDCVKVILNGKCIYNEYDEEEKKEDG